LRGLSLTLKKQIERERERGLEGCKEAEKEEWRLVLKYRLGVKDIISRGSQKPPNTTVTVNQPCNPSFGSVYL